MNRLGSAIDNEQDHADRPGGNKPSHQGRPQPSWARLPILEGRGEDRRDCHQQPTIILDTPKEPRPRHAYYRWRNHSRSYWILFYR